MLGFVPSTQPTKTVYCRGNQKVIMMNTVRKTMTPLEIFNAIENLTDSEKETLAILADKKLSEELMKRRRDAMIEMRKGELISEKELFGEI
jgi:predicted acyltransferase (DUF342 family)